MLTRTKVNTENRQTELVQAALMLAAQRSPAEITTGHLAEKIGITQGGVFKHFDSKDAIWLAVLDWAHQTLIGELKQIASKHPENAFGALRAVFMAHIRFVQQYPGVPRVIFQELQHAKPTPLKNKVQLLMADYRALIAGLLAKANAEGLLAQEVDLVGATVLFMGAVQGLVMQSLVTGSLQHMTHQAIDVFNIYEKGLLGNPMPGPRKRK